MTNIRYAVVLIHSWMVLLIHSWMVVLIHSWMVVLIHSWMVLLMISMVLNYSIAHLAHQGSHSRPKGFLARLLFARSGV